MATITKHYLISGRVQGVGFRAFTQRAALAHDIVGWVRNLRDGSVEAMAHGEITALAEFEATLKSGPRSGKVENFIVKEAKDSQGWFDFQILQDGVDSCIKK